MGAPPPVRPSKELCGTIAIELGGEPIMCECTTIGDGAIGIGCCMAGCRKLLFEASMWVCGETIPVPVTGGPVWSWLI